MQSSAKICVPFGRLKVSKCLENISEKASEINEI